jgi:hypothetical protein
MLARDFAIEVQGPKVIDLSPGIPRAHDAARGCSGLTLQENAISVVRPERQFENLQIVLILGLP